MRLVTGEPGDLQTSSKRFLETALNKNEWLPFAVIAIGRRVVRSREWIVRVTTIGGIVAIRGHGHIVATRGWIVCVRDARSIVAISWRVIGIWCGIASTRADIVV
jgi:hypothetical protein